MLKKSEIHQLAEDFYVWSRITTVFECCYSLKSSVARSQKFARQPKSVCPSTPWSLVSVTAKCCQTQVSDLYIFDPQVQSWGDRV